MKEFDLFLQAAYAKMGSGSKEGIVLGCNGDEGGGGGRGGVGGTVVEAAAVAVVMVMVVVVLGLELVMVVVTLVAYQYLVVRQVIDEQLELHHAHAHIHDSAEAVLQGPHHARKTDHLEHHHGQNHVVYHDEHFWWPQQALQALDVHVDSPAEMEYESLVEYGSVEV
ncbi:hypothetical protein EV421DRAFT_1744483 [Armillaria borealis]|uniref:Uncharacterized protein n=1 Tax=Armillaria borealis TaxID=47425 RepID=A0AA39IW95_9AGAR|nr:hypothetical protein EV421DRAFT_1744483 [Armillaria borealis]